MTTALVVLRAKELGFSIWELKLMRIGLVFDMYTEKNNDSHEYEIQGDSDSIRRMFGG
jgi:hypothetical protein